MFGKVTLAVALIAPVTGAKPKQARRQDRGADGLSKRSGSMDAEGG